MDKMKMSQPGIAKEATAPHNFYGFEYQNGAFLIGTYRHFFLVCHPQKCFSLKNPACLFHFRYIII